MYVETAGSHNVLETTTVDGDFFLVVAVDPLFAARADEGFSVDAPTTAVERNNSPRRVILPSFSFEPCRQVDHILV